MVWSDHPVGTGDQLYHSALWIVAVCDEGRGTQGYDNARNLRLGCALHGLLNAVGRAVDTLPAAGLVVARIINAAFAPQGGANFVDLCTFSPQFSKREELEALLSKSVHITGAS